MKIKLFAVCFGLMFASVGFADEFEKFLFSIPLGEFVTSWLPNQESTKEGTAQDEKKQSVDKKEVLNLATNKHQASSMVEHIHGLMMSIPGIFAEFM